MTAARPHPEEVLAKAKAATSDAELLELAEQLRLHAAGDIRTVIQTADFLVSRAGPRSRARVRALAARAHARCYANDFDAALGDLESACALADGTLADELPVLLMGRIQPLARLGRLREAEEAARQAGVLFRRHGNVPMSAKAAANLGIVLRMLGRPAEAIERFREALEVLAEDPPSVAALQSNLAEAYLELDRFAEASSAFDRARRILRGSAHVHAAAIVEGNLAYLYGRMGRIDESIATFERAREAYAQADARGDLARLIAEEAETLVAAGAVRRSIRHFERAIPALEQAGMPREAAKALMSMGAALLRRGSQRRAAEAIGRALRIARGAGAETIVADASLALGEAALVAGNAEEARKRALECLDLLADRPFARASAAMLLAQAHLAADEPEQAWVAGESAQSQLGAHPPAPLRARLLHTRGLIRARQGRHAEAAELLRQAVRIAESFRGSMRAEHLRLAAHEATQDLYVHAVEAILDAGGPGAASEAFDVLERKRARTLLERCAASLTSPSRGAAPDESDQIRASLATLNALYSRFGTGVGPSRDDPEARARLAVVEAEYERLLGLATHGRGLASSLAVPRSLAEARGEMPAGSVVVNVFLDGSHASVMTVSRDEVVVARRVMPMGEVESRCRRLELLTERALAGVDREAWAEWERGLMQLRERLLGGVRQQIIAAERVALVVFGALARVPLHVAPLLEGLPLRVETYTPNVSVGLSLPAQALSESPRVLAVGVSDSVAPLMEEEASCVASCWGGAEQLRGSEASASAVLEALPRADLVHLACHCVFDDEFPLSTRLMLGDRWVTARELIARMKPGVFVVLAGCESGRESSAAGDEQLGLKHAVIGAGASGVVSVPWPVHDSTARDLFVSVHRHMASLDGPIWTRAARAIAAEQSRMRSAGLPFHAWAGLSVTGAIR